MSLFKATLSQKQKSKLIDRCMIGFFISLTLLAIGGATYAIMQDYVFVNKTVFTVKSVDYKPEVDRQLHFIGSYNHDVRHKWYNGVWHYDTVNIMTVQFKDDFGNVFSQKLTDDDDVDLDDIDDGDIDEVLDYPTLTPNQAFSYVETPAYYQVVLTYQDSKNRTKTHTVYMNTAPKRQHGHLINIGYVSGFNNVDPTPKTSESAFNDVVNNF